MLEARQISSASWKIALWKKGGPAGTTPALAEAAGPDEPERPGHIDFVFSLFFASVTRSYPTTTTTRSHGLSNEAAPLRLRSSHDPGRLSPLVKLDDPNLQHLPGPSILPPVPIN